MITYHLSNEEKKVNTAIDLYIISGFLGSGKTSLLKNLLEDFKDKRIGVLINEFGRVGVDGIQVGDEEIELIEINNGSIFCSCLKGGFIQALIDLSNTNIEMLVIENSGMADPSNMHQVLGEIENKVSRKYDYKGAICIVDSTSFLKHVQVLAPIHNQVASSNLILINKIDRVNQGTIEEIESKIKEINPSAYLSQTMYSKIPLNVLEENLIDNGYTGETSNQPWNRPATYSAECEGTFDYEDILTFINKLKDYTFRIKGFLKSSENWWQVDVVGDDIKVFEYSLGKRDILTMSKLVIIGKDTKDFGQEIKDSWENVFHIKPAIYSDFDDGCR